MGDKGYWMESNNRPKSYLFRCSSCGMDSYFVGPTRSKEKKKTCGYRYCPHCGIEMDLNYYGEQRWIKISLNRGDRL